MTVKKSKAPLVEYEVKKAFETLDVMNSKIPFSMEKLEEAAEILKENPPAPKPDPPAERKPRSCHKAQEEILNEQLGYLIGLNRSLVGKEVNHAVSAEIRLNALAIKELLQ